MRRALADLTDGIRWRALVAAWVLTLIAVAILAATGAPVVTAAMVVAGAGAVIALAIAGGALERGNDADVFEAMLSVQASLTRELRVHEAKMDARFSEIVSAGELMPSEPERSRLPPPERSSFQGGAKMQLAANLRRLRKQRGISQEQLATLAGLHPTEVSRLERALREPRLRTVMQVAKALDIPVQDLIGPAEDRERVDAPAFPPPESS